MPIDPAAAGTADASPHGSFALEVLLDAPADDVWRGIVEGERRGRWLRLPGRPGPQTAVDLAPGVTETLHAQASTGDTVENLERTTHVVDVVPGHRLVLAYRAVVDDRPRWASLLTLQLDPPPDGRQPSAPSRLRWTEQYAFLAPAGPDDLAHLRGGTRLLLTALAVTLGATPRPATVVPA